MNTRFQAWTAGFKAALLVSVVVPSAALAGSSFLIEGGAGRTELSGIEGISPQQDGYTVFNGSARYQYQSASSFLLQADVDGEFSDISSGEASENFEEFYQLGLHLAGRNPQQGLLGLFGGAGSTVSDNGTKGNGGEVDYAFIGLEAHGYGNNTTVILQGGGLDSENSGNTPEDSFREAWFLRGVGRWFPTDNSALEFELAYADGVNDADKDDSTVTEWGVRYDWAFHTSATGRKTGLFLAYRGALNKSAVGEEYNDNTIMVGLRWSSTPGTLLQQDRSGPSLDLPGFGRWVATGEIFD